MHVVSIEYIDHDNPVDVYDISVESDESFLLANGIIAHNSTICLARHGLRYTIPAHEPINHAIPYLNGVPYHPNCRSSMIPVLRGGGPVMQETLSAWLRRQGSAYQDEVLGPTRAALFRAGTIASPRDLLSSTGKPLTLEELGV